ncbi:hypothetical protein FRB99_000229, partial [Tulasnella sp. 403]
LYGIGQTCQGYLGRRSVCCGCSDGKGKRIQSFKRFRQSQKSQRKECRVSWPSTIGKDEYPRNGQADYLLHQEGKGQV